MTELLEVIGRDGKVKRVASREEVHSKGLLHKVEHVLVFNRKGELYLQKRGARLELFPGMWESSSSGHVGAGETFEAAAARELKEEIGLSARLQKLFDIRMRHRWRNFRENTVARVFKVVTDTQPRPTPVETSGGKWVSLEELNAMIRRGDKVTPSLQKIFARGKKLNLFKPEN
ncbi:MAG: NUDIX hydrolase [Candidatus Micrarchaeia archaeon]|jgi:isopentenyl-diphosphate delta-isomerase